MRVPTAPFRASSRPPIRARPIPTSTPYISGMRVGQREDGACPLQQKLCRRPDVFLSSLACELAAPSTGLEKNTMMRHGNRVKHLGRPADQRKALIRNLVTQVILHGKIKTTKVSHLWLG